MPNKKHSTSLINSNIDATNCKLNSKANIGENDSDNILSNIKPNFPPSLTKNDLIKNALKTDISYKSKAKILPNAFIAYRM